MNEKELVVMEATAEGSKKARETELLKFLLSATIFFAHFDSMEQADIFEL